MRSLYPVAIAFAMLIPLFSMAAACFAVTEPRPAVCDCSSCGRVVTVHADQLPRGASPGDVLAIGHHYVASLDPVAKVATWCAYRVTDAEASSRNQIGRNWLHGFEGITLEADDYAGPEYDMGHLVALASFSGSRYAHELNWTGIVAPQTPELNRGPWLKLEYLARELARDHPSVGVVCGPLFESDLGTLPAADEPHAIPSHYWAVLTPEGGDPSAWIVPQGCGRSDPIDAFAVDLADVERRSGLLLGPGPVDLVDPVACPRCAAR